MPPGWLQLLVVKPIVKSLVWPLDERPHTLTIWRGSAGVYATLNEASDTIELSVDYSDNAAYNFAEKTLDARLFPTKPLRACKFNYLDIL